MPTHTHNDPSAKGADFGASNAACTDTFFDEMTGCTCDAGVTTLSNMGGLPNLGCTPAFQGNETHNATGPSSLVKCVAKGHRLECIVYVYICMRIMQFLICALCA